MVVEWWGDNGRDSEGDREGGLVTCRHAVRAVCVSAHPTGGIPSPCPTVSPTNTVINNSPPTLPLPSHTHPTPPCPSRLPELCLPKMQKCKNYHIINSNNNNSSAKLVISSSSSLFLSLLLKSFSDIINNNNINIH